MQRANYIVLLGLLFWSPVLRAQQFIDQALELGIDHSMNSSDGFGAGVSFFDVDGDGWDDITLINENSQIQLYLNNAGEFNLVETMPMVAGTVRQALWVDYDNDDDNDLIVSTDGGGGSLRLFRNDGALTLTDVTFIAGLSGLTGSNYGVSFADYDRDGDLDFYLARYQAFGNPSDALANNALYRNNGNGTFTNVYYTSGAVEPTAPTFMGVWVDFDRNGWADLFVINDKPSWDNSTFRNLGGGSFENITEETNTAMVQDDPMSATFADFDNDGDLDFYSTNTGHPDTRARLMVNQNGETFTDEAPERGVDLPAWSWGASFFDADNDGFLDLFTATGYTAAHWEPEIASVLYHNNGDHTFNALDQAHFTGSLVAASYGVAIGDANNDGYGDIAVLNAESYNSNLWVSQSEGNNYVKVTLKGTISNRMAIGAWVDVYSEGDHFVHYTRCGENYCGQNSQHHIFGLGQRQTIDSLKVWYPSGHQDAYYNVPVNSHIYLTEGETLPDGLTASNEVLCSGEVAVLTPEYTGEVLWSTGSVSTQLEVSSTGTFFYEYITELGFEVKSDTLTILVDTAPQVNIFVQHPNCANTNDGSIGLQANPPVQNFTVLINGMPGDALNASLPIGDYAIELISSLGCSYYFDAELIAAPAIEALVSVTEPNCFGDLADASVFAFGGVPPYTYTWSTGSASLIPAGNHSVTVTDENGCMEVFSFGITEPNEITLSAFETLGVLQVAAEGGTPPYTINGTTPLGTPFTGTSVALTEDGDYTVTAVDALDCSATTVYTHTALNVGDSVLDLRCFPNPVVDWLTVELGTITIQSYTVYDVSGRTLRHRQNVNATQLRIDFSGLSTGLYTLELEAGNERFRKVLLH